MQLGDLVTWSFIVGLAAASIRLAIPMLLAALGETVTERSGVLNLGVEGIMLVGAFCGFWVSSVTGSNWWGLLAGALAGGLSGLLMAFMSITLRAQQVVSSFAIYIMSGGLVIVLNRTAFGATLVLPRIDRFRAVELPGLSQIPVLGPILFQQDIVVYATLLLVLLLWIVLFRTTLGVRITATGENPRAADSVGLNVSLIRYFCTVFGGMVVGLGGAYIPLAEVGAFVNNITAGRGFIALAIVVLGGWNPVGALFGALLFGAVEALQLRAQSQGVSLPFQFIAMLPYLLTIVALLLVSRRAIGPTALGVPYLREEK
jgi:simple sugar transport system permease protein